MCCHNWRSSARPMCLHGRGLLEAGARSLQPPPRVFAHCSLCPVSSHCSESLALSGTTCLLLGAPSKWSRPGLVTVGTAARMLQ